MAAVLVPLVEGFEEIEAVSIVDVLRRGGVEVVTAATGDGLEVTGAHGMAMKAEVSIAAVADGDFDAIVLPGGPGTRGLLASAALVGLLRRQAADGKLIGAICAAPTVLTGLQLVSPEVRLTCYPSCVAELGRDSAGVPCAEDGVFITGQAPGSAMLFALVILKRLAGEAVAREVARGMVTDLP